jgi:predicted dehydrogenase
MTPYEKAKDAVYSPEAGMIRQLREAGGMQQKIRVGVVGLGFGKEFVPIYQAHPDVAAVAVCDADPARLAAVAAPLGIDRRYARFEELIADRELDAIHVVSGIPDHARQVIAALRAGKHCACTVPMATSLADLRAIIRAVRATGRNYMMMETAVYTRDFLYAQDLLAAGRLGRLQFLRGAHYQDMECWPPYWAGLPPMWYATHAIGPCLALAGTRATEVHCYGAGAMRAELHRPYGNPFPVETAIFRLAREDLAMEVTRSLFHTGRCYTEMFNAYGENATFEWPQLEGLEHPVLHELSPVVPGQRRTATQKRIEIPDAADRLPEPIRRFTQRHEVLDKNHQSFKQGGGHGGSHPHLVHEFVRSIVERRKPRIDEITAANWTAAGICAHASALRGGRRVRVPAFE